MPFSTHSVLLSMLEAAVPFAPLVGSGTLLESVLLLPSLPLPLPLPLLPLLLLLLLLLLSALPNAHASLLSILMPLLPPLLLQWQEGISQAK